MLLTIVVPPAITGFRRQRTHCIAPSRVNIVQRLLLSADLDRRRTSWVFRVLVATKKCSGNCLKMYTIHLWVVVRLRPCMRWRHAIPSSPWITNTGTSTNQVEGDCHRSGCARRNCCETTWASTVRIERYTERLHYACTFVCIGCNTDV